MANEKRFAVLIDADNISSKYIKFIFDEISGEGVTTYKRIYGDWTKPDLAAWKSVLLDNSITPIQQYGYTSGKNATDAAMIIDAMDILYSGNVDGFCLVTSDSDFTKLASRLRESGMDVVGMGESKTPKPFIVACNKFKYLDILAKEAGDQIKEEVKEPVKEEKETEEMTSLDTIRSAIVDILGENSDEDDWVLIGDIGNMLLKRYPDFDVRNFGYKKLTPFIRSLGVFEIKAERHGGSNSRIISVREKG